MKRRDFIRERVLLRDFHHRFSGNTCLEAVACRGGKIISGSECCATSSGDGGREASSAYTLTKGIWLRAEEIDRNGPRLNAIIEINPDALNIARALDVERAKSWRRAARCTAFPVLIKDNIADR